MHSRFPIAAALVVATSLCAGCRLPANQVPVVDETASPPPSGKRTGLVTLSTAPAGERELMLTEPTSSFEEPVVLVSAEQEPTDLPSGPLPPGEPTLALSDLEELALTSNPTLRHANAHVQAARGRRLQAGLYPNPTVGYHAVNVGARGTAGRQAGFIQQRFVTGGKLELDERVAGHGIRNAQSQFAVARQRVLTDVRARFYQTLVAQRRRELAEELVGIAAKMVTSTKKLVDSEQASENTLLQAEIESEQAEILLDNSTNELRERWQQLAVVAGQPGMTQPVLVGDFESEPVHDLDELRADLVAKNPMLAAARARTERARVAIIRARQEVVPDVTLMADAARTNQVKSNTAQVRLGVEVPLWDRNEGNIAVAESELAGARAEYRRIELLLRQRLVTVFRQYANARHQTRRYRESIVPRAERSLKLVREGYDNGQVDYLTLLNSQQKFVQVSLAHADALEALQTSSVLLDGQLLDDSLSKGDE